MSPPPPSLLQRLRARKASLAELQALHSDNHVKLYGRSSQRKPGQDKKGAHEHPTYNCILLCVCVYDVGSFSLRPQPCLHPNELPWNRGTLIDNTQ